MSKLADDAQEAVRLLSGAAESVLTPAMNKQATTAVMAVIEAYRRHVQTLRIIAAPNGPLAIRCPFDAGFSPVYRNWEEVPEWWPCSCGAEHERQ